jgi:predicted nucleic acid-binding protein
MNDKPFIDTNVLIYAYDLDAGIKHRRASELIRLLWSERGGILSTQVLQEFHVNVTRKIPRPISPATARGIIDTYRAWQVETISIDTVLRASEYQERHQLSFWDGVIIAAAVQGSATVLLTEDLNAGQMIEGVEINNPFLV